jgi:hypothetical protein
VDDEVYLGGVAGGSLARKGFGFGGYEIHATNKRIFGVRELKHLGEVYKGVFFTGSLHPAHLVNPADKNPAFIQELEKRKDFVLNKEDVRGLLFEKPSWLRNGSLSIADKSGDKILIRVQGQNGCDLLLELMEKFYPQVIERR